MQLNQNLEKLFNQIEKYTEINIEDLQKFSKEDCDEASLILFQASYRLQKELNFAKARKNYYNNQVMSMVGKNWSNYDKYMPSDVKIPTICESEKSIQEISKSVSEQQNIIDSLDGMSFIVRNLSEKFADVAKNKYWENKNG